MEQVGKAERKLVLGTVQFGLPYGATNVSGQVLEQEVAEIVALAAKVGVNCIDTASGYGTSEFVLGALLPDYPALQVITKLPAIGASTITDADIRAARQTLSQSLQHLRRDHVEGLLVHNTADLRKQGGRKVWELLQSLKRDGIARRIGVSVYDAQDIDGVLSLFTPDIVQLPVNLFDQRLIESGHIGKLKAAGVDVHARSAFLQGVLLAERDKRPAYFRTYDDVFARYEAFLGRNSLSRIRASLGFAMEESGADRVLVGVTSVNELREILASASGSPLPSMRSLASDDPALVDPRGWTLPATRGQAS